jgi:hypothetical protein
MAQEYASVDLSRARWYKSSYSNGGEGGCIEVADNLPGVVAVRDSKDPGGPKLMFAAAVWQGFVERVKKERPGA